jgi:N6-L-threonylcarbamoyladenine synthase
MVTAPIDCVLGIETSCDETAVGIVRAGRHVLANVVRSQNALHAPFRGVVPEIAGRSHLQQILPVIEEALRRAALELDAIDAVAVTQRPGLIGCLLVGLAAAKALAALRSMPLVGVDHIAAHVHAAWMAEPQLAYPALCLVASGGHTAIYRSTAPGHIERLGTTRDDAAGEALDKAAVLLGLPYPGGPSIQRAARAGDPDSLHFKRTLLEPESLDFSFSGLKTALLYHLRGNGLTRPMPELSERQVADLAAAFQAAVVEILVTKLERALSQVDARSIAIGGGVARNELLRERLAPLAVRRGVQLVYPPLELCSDNGAMIASLGWLQLEAGQRDDLDLDAVATGGRGWSR